MRARSLLVLLLAPLLAVAGCSSGTPQRSTTGPRVVIVGQSFTEADVVSQLLRALLASAGFDATVRKVGARDLYLAPLEKGTVQVAADSLASTTDALDHLATGNDVASIASSDVSATLAQLQRVGEQAGLTPLRPMRAELKSGYAVTRTFAARHHLRTLSDLARLGRPIALAAGPDCNERPDCARGLERVYGIEVGKVEPLGAGTSDTKAALAQGQVQLGQVATTDPQLDSSLVLLEDDQHLLKAENLVPLVNADWLAAHERAGTALDRLSDVLTTADLRALTAQVNSGRTTARAVARAYLKKRELL
jgi:osmoprotectant transport system substrate-binding protein